MEFGFSCLQSVNITVDGFEEIQHLYMIHEQCGQVRPRSQDEVLFCCTSYSASKVGCTAGCVGEVVSVHDEFIHDLDVPHFEGQILTICEQ